MSEGRRILFVHASADLYGSDRVLLEIVRALGPNDRALVALPMDVDPEGPLFDALAGAGASIRLTRMTVLRRAYLRPLALPRLALDFARGIGALRRIIRDEDIDLVVTNTIVVPCGAVAAAIGRRPHLWYVHETLSDEPWPLRLLLRALPCLLPGRIIANSRASARALVGGNRSAHRRTRVVYPGLVEPEEAPAEAAEVHERRPFTVVVVGRLAPRKGIAEALTASAIAREHGVDVRLHLFGSPPPGQEWREGELRRLAGDLGIAEYVRFHGFVADVRERLSEFDVVLVPSQRPEPFGLTLVEGMAAGRTVIACRNGGGSDELMTDGVTGLYVEPMPDAIAAALVMVAGDPALRAEIGRRAAVAALEQFSIEQFRRRITAQVDALTAGRP